jgi:hypothetical protein
MTEPDIVRVIDDLRQCDGRHRNIGVYTFDNAIEAIEQLRKERDEAIRQRDDASVDQRLIDELWQRRTDASETNARMRQLLKDTEQLKLTVSRMTEDLRRGDAVTNLITGLSVSRKLREKNHNA